MNRMRFAVIAFILSLVLAVCAGGGIVYGLTRHTTSNANFSKELREELVRNCATNGNPLRRAVQGLLREQIRNAESPEIRRLFPQIPEQLLEAHIAADENRLIEIAPVSCANQYPNP